MREETNENQLEEAKKRRQLELQIKQALLQILDGSAYERLMNIKISNEEIYEKIVNLLVYLYQNGQLKNKISETELKKLTAKILEKKGEGTIKFVRK